MAAQAVQERQDQRKRSMTGLAVVVGAVLVIGGLLWLTSSNDDKASTTSTTAPPTTVANELVARPFEYGTTACPPAAGADKATLDFSAPPKNCLTKGKSYTATFETTAGPIEVDLDTTKTPGTVNNFVFLARNKYYDDTVLFRADANIDIVQGGSPHTQDNSDPGPGYDLQDEGKFNADATLGEYRYKAGDLVMARSTKVDGASAQFFFVTGPLAAAGLDSQGVYVTFGHVTKGLDVLQKMIETVQGDVPNPEVKITKVTIAES